MLSDDGSDAVGADAIGAVDHSDGIGSPSYLLPRRPWPLPIQRRKLHDSLSIFSVNV